MSAAEERENAAAVEGEDEQQRSAKALVREAWAQAVVAVNTVEEEVQRFLGRVGSLVEVGPEEARRLAGELTERLRRERNDLEERVELGVKRTLSALRLPHREEIGRLDKQLDRMEQRLDRLLARRAEAREARR